MAKRTITALYDSYDQAADAVRRIEALGISHADISIVANNEGDRYSSHATRRDMDRDNGDESHADDGAGTGATAGTLIGGGAGLLAGLGLLAIPGLGPVVAAGWLITTLTGAGVGAAVGGLVGGLVGAGVPEEHAEAYAEGVRRGGTLVTVRADDEYVDRIVDIMDDNGSVDMDERERSWRETGWSGSATSSNDAHTGLGSTAGTAAGYGADRTTMTGTTTGYNADRSLTGSAGDDRMAAGTGSRTDYDRTTRTTTGSGLGAAASRAVDAVSDTVSDAASAIAGTRSNNQRMGTADRTGTETGFGTDRDRESIEVVQEDLHVGKRDVSRGRVRVHSRVIETPIEEQVSLREERVEVERRPVDRPLTDADRAFQDRTIEVEERGEEAVVSKDARVTEEVVLGKNVQDRTQTVSDTVRRTEVEVEDDRSARIPERDRKI